MTATPRSGPEAESTAAPGLGRHDVPARRHPDPDGHLDGQPPAALSPDGPAPGGPGRRRRLSAAARGETEPLRGLFLDLAGIDAWLERWGALGPDAVAVDRVDPRYIPRHLVEEALTAATAGDLDPFHQLLEVVTSPYDERSGLERYTEPAPEGSTAYRTSCGT